MSCILHISDTHHKCICKKSKCICTNGYWITRLASQLKKNKIQPDLIIHSGDLTGKSRKKEFEIAAKEIDILRKITPNVLVIPGNQDSFRDGKKYFKEFFGDPYKTISVDKFFAVGVDSTESTEDIKTQKRFETVRHYDHLAKIHRGFIGPEHYKWIKNQFKKATPNQLKVFVLHHHLIHIPGTGINESILIDDADVMQLLMDCGVDIVLAGHRHKSWYWKIRDEHAKSLRIFHSGRLSELSKNRDEDQGYNIIYAKGKKAIVERYHLDKPNKPAEKVTDWTI